MPKPTLPPFGGLHDATPHARLLQNATGRAGRVVEADVDGVAVEVIDGAARVSLMRDGRSRRVQVRLG